MDFRHRRDADVVALSAAFHRSGAPRAMSRYTSFRCASIASWHFSSSPYLLPPPCNAHPPQLLPRWMLLQVMAQSIFAISTRTRAMARPARMCRVACASSCVKQAAVAASRAVAARSGTASTTSRVSPIRHPPTTAAPTRARTRSLTLRLTADQARSTVATIDRAIERRLLHLA